MGLQKYRVDEQGEAQQNGGVPCYTRWIGGPTLALIKNCICENDPTLTPRTVYISGEHDTLFSQPAACRIRGKTVRGYVTCDDNRELVFRRYLPWITTYAGKLQDLIDQKRRVIQYMTTDAFSKPPQDVLDIYEGELARMQSVFAKLAARIVRRVVAK